MLHNKTFGRTLPQEGLDPMFLSACQSMVLNKNVAIKLIIGHIIQQIQIDIAYVIIWGLSCGVTTLNARILAYFPTIKKF